MAGLNLGDVWNAVTAYRENEKRIQREQAVQRVKDAAINGTGIELSPNDIATVKLYARAKAVNELNNSIDTLIEIRDDPDAKGSERIKAAETLIARAIGPVEAPSAIPFATDLSKASPTEIIDALIEGVNTGAVSANLRAPSKRCSAQKFNLKSSRT